MIPLSEIDALGILWMLRLDKPLPGGPEPGIPVTFQRAGPEIAGELAQVMQLDNPALVSERFSTGRHCYVGRVEGKIATYGWITFDQEDVGELGLTIRLQKGEAYIWDCATLPAYRGQRLYPALLAFMLGELQRTGFQRVWIGTNADNLPSQSGVALVGCQPVLEIIQAPNGDLLSRGRPGVPFQDVLDAHFAFFGNRDLTRVVMPESRE
jgi:GNAT superfamily N-acetyltransferase